MTTLPLFAFFQQPDGSWYRLWITHTTPKTRLGHPWRLHAAYDKSGTVAPIARTRWYEQPYGVANRDFDCEADVLAAFEQRVVDRLAHGYVLCERAPPAPPN